MNQNVFAELITLRDWVRYGASLFSEAGVYFGHGTDNAWDESLTLSLWAIHQSWNNLSMIIDCRLSSEEKEKIAVLLERRIKERVPAAYLTGEAWFAEKKYWVTPDVLVPRSPIAELIANNFEPWIALEPHSILDLCTGSGCIGIECAHQFPDANVLLSDISESALQVANKNIALHEVQGRVHAVCSDGFNSIPPQKFDLIVANPPYVDAQDYSAMPEEFRAEPALGLVSGNDGLDFTRRILRDAHNYLSENGSLIVEVGNSWAALEEAFPDVPFIWPEFEGGGHGVFVLSKR